MDGFALMGAIGGVVGAAAGIGAAIVAVPAKNAARRAADAAIRSADEAARIARIEADRRHDDLGPVLSAELDAEKEPVERPVGHALLWGSITVHRDYRVQAEAMIGPNATSPISMPGLLIRAGRPTRFVIEPWDPGKTGAMVEEIRFRFWPPLAQDDVELWSCPCGRPEGHDTSGPGHWERRVAVRFYDTADSVL